MAIDKIQSESINLADNFAFTGTVTGAGGTNTPAFMARLSSSQTLANDTHTTVVFQTEDFDVGSDYDNSTGIFTCGEAGKYLFGGSLFFIDGNGNISDMIGYIHSTISSSASQDLIIRSESTSNGTLFTDKSNSWTQMYTLGVGDAIKIQAWQETNNSSSVSIGHGRKSYFWGIKIIE
tara:strand:- start:196 stop:729 length:534 start_codon:yes stop_codon:yes gene_type:complete